MRRSSLGTSSVGGCGRSKDIRYPHRWDMVYGLELGPAPDVHEIEMILKPLRTSKQPREYTDESVVAQYVMRLATIGASIDLVIRQALKLPTGCKISRPISGAMHYVCYVS